MAPVARCLKIKHDMRPSVVQGRTSVLEVHWSGCELLTSNIGLDAAGYPASVACCICQCMTSQLCPRRRAYQRHRERQRQQKDTDRLAIAALEGRLQALELERSQLEQRVDVLQKVVPPSLPRAMHDSSSYKRLKRLCSVAVLDWLGRWHLRVQSPRHVQCTAVNDFTNLIRLSTSPCLCQSAAICAPNRVCADQQHEDTRHAIILCNRSCRLGE